MGGVGPLIKQLLQKEVMPVIIQADNNSMSGLVVKVIDAVKLAAGDKEVTVSIATKAPGAT